MGLVGINLSRWDNAVTIFDYVAIGFLAICSMWAATVLLARSHDWRAASGQDATEREGRE
jgi:hypothetical protein